MCCRCFLVLPRFDSSLCLKCGLAHDQKSCLVDWAKNLNHLFAVFAYEDPIPKWISSLKYNRNFVTGRMFQRFILNWFQANREFLRDIDLILPIPLHPLRLFNRGYNQAVYLLSRQKTVPVDTKMLRKKSWTAQQAGKTKKERMANVKNSFEVTGDLSNKRVLLFDDVCTTGQTLFEVSRILRKAGVSHMDALVLCRSLKVI